MVCLRDAITLWFLIDARLFTGFWGLWFRFREARFPFPPLGDGLFLISARSPLDFQTA